MRRASGKPMTVDLQAQLQAMAARLEAIEAEVRSLKGNGTEPSGETKVLRAITREQARSEIIGLLGAGEALDQAEIADRLSLDLLLVADVCDGLIAEGSVKYSADDRGLTLMTGCWLTR